MREQRKIKKSIGERIITAVVACVMMAACVLCIKEIKADAAEAPSVVVTSIDYDKSTITIRMDAKDTILYMSTSAAMKKWEFVQAEKNSDNLITLDISWVSMTKDYVLAFKGNYSSTPVQVTLPKQIANFKVTYNLYDGTIEEKNNPSERDVQWRKKDALSWNDYEEEMFEEEISSFIANGATIVFRLKPVDGSLDAFGQLDEGLRPSKEVSLVIPKKIAAPIIKVNDSHATIPVTKGMQYRYVDEDGNPDPSNPWIDVTASKEIPLSTIAYKAMVETGAPEDVYIQFRTKATSAKQMSNVSTVTIPAQQNWTETDSASCSVVYTSSTSFNLTISAASVTYPYEYCIITKDDQKAGTTIDSFEEITWKQVTSKDPITVNKDKDDVEDDSIVYVRRAAYKTLGDDDYEIPSPIHELATIHYPGDISTGSSGIIWLQTVAGVCTPSNPSGYLTFTFYSATENVIEEIEFVDFASPGTIRATLTRSSGAFKSEVALNSDQSSIDKKYIITTTIMDTSTLDGFAVNDGQTSRRKMLAYITQKDSTDKFKSTPDKGIGLYIHPATTVDNPSEGDKKETETLEIANLFGWTSQGYIYEKDKIGFTTSITRMVDSTRAYREGLTDANWDQAQFRIKLDFGTRYIPVGSSCGTLDTTEKVEITSIKYDGVTFIPAVGVTSGAACYVEYCDTTSDSDKGSENIRSAVLTINADVIEKNTAIDDRNKKAPIIIYLNNGEVLKNVLDMNLQETAYLEKSASWTITEKSLKEVDTLTETTSAGVTSTTTTDHVDRSIELIEYSGIDNVNLVSVTWKGKSVCTNIKHSGDRYTMDLSNKEINKIDVSSTESAYLVFEFDNGFKITTGWKLTINPSATD